METMNQVQRIQIRGVEIVELMRCDSIVSAAASTPPAGRRGVERNTTSIKIHFLPIHTCWFASRMPLYILSITSIKTFFLSEVFGSHVSFFFFSFTTPACAVMGSFHKIILRVSNKRKVRKTYAHTESQFGW